MLHAVSTPNKRKHIFMETKSLMWTFADLLEKDDQDR